MTNQNQNQNQSKQEPSQDVDLMKFHLRRRGQIAGPTFPSGPSFVLVFGLFDESGIEAVHTYDDGTIVPVVIISNPIPLNRPLITKSSGIIH
jgi:hypothetical protein